MYSSTIRVSEVFIPTRRVSNKLVTRERGPSETDHVRLQDLANLIAEHGGYLDLSKVIFRAVSMNFLGVSSLPYYSFSSADCPRFQIVDEYPGLPARSPEPLSSPLPAIVDPQHENLHPITP
jgi:hypothetical protein